MNSRSRPECAVVLGVPAQALVLCAAGGGEAEDVPVYCSALARSGRKTNTWAAIFSDF